MSQAHLPARPAAPAPRVLLAGAQGVLGGEVLQRLAASPAFGPVTVLAGGPLAPRPRGVAVREVPGGDPAGWPAAPADIGIVLFEAPPPQESAPWAPQPARLVPLARWLRAGGVDTLAVVLPQAPGRLPEAIQRGLAGLDEHEVVTLGFERVLFLRPAQPAAVAASRHPLDRLAAWMLSFSRYMIPQAEQPVRAAKVAEFLAAALRLAPPGVHVASPGLLWQAAQGELEAVVRGWSGAAA